MPLGIDPATECDNRLLLVEIAAVVDADEDTVEEITVSVPADGPEVVPTTADILAFVSISASTSAD